MVKRYLLISEYFHPETAATGQLMTNLAVGLRERGLDLTVYTSQPNYHGDEFDRLPSVSEYRGVEVRRVRAPQVRQSSVARRLVDWAVFTTAMVAALLARRSDREEEVIVVSNPPILPVAVWLVCRLRGWEYTYVVHDLWPDAGVELGYYRRDGLIDRGWSWIHGKVFEDSRKVITLGSAMRDRIGEQTDRAVDRIDVIHNWADGEFIVPQSKEDNPFSRRHGLVEPFTLVYSGNIGESHHLESVVRAVDRYEEGDVKCLIIGEGLKRQRIEDLAADLGATGETVAFLPYQPTEVLPDSLTSGDVSIVALENGMKGINVSSKLYTSLAAGQPILVVSDPGDDEACIVEEYDCGFTAPPGDPEAVVRAIDRWRSDPELVAEQGENARRVFESRFTRGHAIDEYYRVLADGAPPEATADD